MTVTATYTVFCQGGRCGQWAGQEDTIKDARAEAKRLGFAYVKVPNGSKWDFCPECYQRYLEEKE